MKSNDKSSQGKAFRFFSIGWFIWAFLFLGVAIFLCFIPLFHILGYEFSLTFSVLGSIAAISIGVFSSPKISIISHQVSLQKLPPPTSIYVVFWKALAKTEALLLIALIVSLLNHFHVQNCNFLSGFHFYFMMPILSVGCATILGVVLGSLTEKRYRGILLAYGILILFGLWSFWRFLKTPAVHAYDPFFGYYPGPIYDEKIEITVPFYWARLMHVCFSLSALGFTSIWLHRKSLFPQNKDHSRPSSAFHDMWKKCKSFIFQKNIYFPIITLILASVLFMKSGSLRFAVTTQSVESFLSEEKRTAHFLIRYQPGSKIAKDIDRIAKEHEFQYEQLRQTLQVEPHWRPPKLVQILGIDSHYQEKVPPRIVSYLFSSAEQKKDWLGAKYVLVAKPFRREIYLHDEKWSSSALKHELAHIFAGSAPGGSWFRIAINPGVVEGFAEALSSSSSELSLHQQVKVMKKENLIPPLQELLGPFFWRFSSARAYVTMGSFFQFLLIRNGPTKLMELYSAQGKIDSFEKIYGSSFENLQKEWSHFIDAQPLTNDQQKSTQEVFQYPSIFEKKCAHELASRKENIQLALSLEQYEKALLLVDSLCHEDPNHVDHVFWKLHILVYAGRVIEAQILAQTLIQNLKLTPSHRRDINEFLGDFSVLQKQNSSAATFYQEALQIPQNPNRKRTLSIKILSLQYPKITDKIISYLIHLPQIRPNQPPSVKSSAGTIYSLVKLCEAEPQFSLCPYLLGKKLMQETEYEEAMIELKRALSIGLPSNEFIWQAHFLVAQAYFFLGQYSEAQKEFHTVLSLTPQEQEGTQMTIKEWLQRVETWKKL